MNPRDAAFIERRARLLRWWPIAAAAMIASLTALTGWLFVHSPMLVNPLALKARIKANDLAPGTLEIVAMMAPALALFCIAVVAIMIFYGFAITANERRYHKIIDAMNKERGADG